ncbi:MAG TPA: hypothetical protein DCR44_03645 [Acholeplasmatales bacterium]|nr:MAG: hypothetical protein A2Y16_01280 [Tenericutes bacterium GWF2_57_13]HAQ56478.1 hypothetical protein [Acholeplasmatales bacterium]
MNSPQREEILRVVGLKQYFKSGSGRNKIVNKAVDGISFEIYKGEVFSLVGESGCGKTTTGRAIIKLYSSSGGEVFFHGTRIVSDVIAAKKTFQANYKDYLAEKIARTQELKDQLATGHLGQSSFNEKVTELNIEFTGKVTEARGILHQAKRDRRFESIIDEEGLRARKELCSFPECQDVDKKYDFANQETIKLINGLMDERDRAKAAYGQAVENKDKAQIQTARQVLREVTENLVKQQKELKLNEIRRKQDIGKLGYCLTHKNRLLMRRMQMIFQDPIASLNPRMTVKEIIAEGLRINGVKNEKEIEDRVNEALKTVGLVPEHASRYPHEFSGGQRQRIGIARALVVEPSFIIADEPISALDVSIRAQVINLLNEMRETKGITIMFIAHDLSVVKYFSDRVAVMYYGHIVEHGDKDLLFNHPLHPYTLSLMASIPIPDPETEKSRVRTPRYNPAAEHDYSVEQPILREVEPNHFVLCNSAEFARYQEKLSGK